MIIITRKTRIGCIWNIQHVTLQCVRSPYELVDEIAIDLCIASNFKRRNDICDVVSLLLKQYDGVRRWVLSGNRWAVMEERSDLVALWRLYGLNFWLPLLMRHESLLTMHCCPGSSSSRQFKCPFHGVLKLFLSLISSCLKKSRLDLLKIIFSVWQYTATEIKSSTLTERFILWDPRKM